MTNQAQKESQESRFLDIFDGALSVAGAGFSRVTDFISSLTLPKYKNIRYLQKRAEYIMSLSADMKKLSDAQLREKTTEFRERLKKETLDDILDEAFAVAREAAWRVLGEEPYKVQIMGGIVLHKGMIAEMKTGEGKTLVASLPTYLNALKGEGVHVVTVNDYLAERDSKLIGQIFEFLGLTVGCVTSRLGCNIAAKREQYAADVTYCTNNEVGFDYLRDNMATSPTSICQRGFNYCIIDEADSILIDEARTPLIMSGNMSDDEDGRFEFADSNSYKFANEIISQLRPHHYNVKLKEHEVNLTDDGVDKVEELLIQAGVIDKVNVLENNETVLVSLLRSLSGKSNEMSDVVSEMTSEDYTKEGGITESGYEKAEKILLKKGVLTKFYELYTHKHSVLLHQLSQCLKAHHLFRKDKDYVVERGEGIFGIPEMAVKIVDEHTGRVLNGRRYSDGLHQALEAKENCPIKPESNVLASITFQCLFRLYKKISGMTGTALSEEEEFEKSYNLECIRIPTNKKNIRIDHPDMFCPSHESKTNEIIKQVSVCHEKGQPVLLGAKDVDSAEYYYHTLLEAGFSQKYVSLLSAKHHEKEAEIIANAGRLYSITVVTNMAGRGTDIKLGGDLKTILKQLNITDEEQKSNLLLEIKENQKKVRSVGGLFVISAEYNLNKRIDDQLRGRSARQGDPGETMFFIGPEDTLLKDYNPTLSVLVSDFDEPFQSQGLSNNSVRKVQRSLEAMQFESRQSMQRYSDIKESYMLQLYKKRSAILTKSVLSDLKNDFNLFLKDESNIKWLTERNEYLQSDSENSELTKIIDSFDSSLKKINEKHLNNADQFVREVLLKSLDNAWCQYLEFMSYARDTVSFQSYAQKDPVLLYSEIADQEFRVKMKEAFRNIFESIVTEKYSLHPEIGSMDDIFESLDISKQFSDDGFMSLKNMLKESGFFGGENNNVSKILTDHLDNVGIGSEPSSDATQYNKNLHNDYDADYLTQQDFEYNTAEGSSANPENTFLDKEGSLEDISTANNSHYELESSKILQSTDPLEEDQRLRYDDLNDLNHNKKNIQNQDIQDINNNTKEDNDYIDTDNHHNIPVAVEIAGDYLFAEEEDILQVPLNTDDKKNDSDIEESPVHSNHKASEYDSNKDDKAGGTRENTYNAEEDEKGHDLNQEDLEKDNKNANNKVAESVEVAEISNNQHVNDKPPNSNDTESLNKADTKDDKSTILGTWHEE